MSLRILIILFLFVGINSNSFSQVNPAITPGAPGAETMPVFPGGQDAMIKHMQDNLKLPKGFGDKKISGQVVVMFMVDKTGKVKNISVKEGLSPEADSAAADVIRSMPDWKPGMKDGKPVDAYMSLPVNFRKQ